MEAPFPRRSGGGPLPTMRAERAERRPDRLARGARQRARRQIEQLAPEPRLGRPGLLETNEHAVPMKSAAEVLRSETTAWRESQAVAIGGRLLESRALGLTSAPHRPREGRH